MPAPTERILGLLPHTFRADARRTALHALAAAFGEELMSAENALAEVLRAHWVDHADLGAAEIDDLARIAALYGLAPRGARRPGESDEEFRARLRTEPPFPEETVEEFRAHLKSWVRIFLEGPATVHGVLRIAAETLGLRVDDDPERLDAWWRRADDAWTTVVPLGDDRALSLLGFAGERAEGRAAEPARIRGMVPLGGGVDLRGAGVLAIAVDGDEAVVDLRAAAADQSAVTGDEMVAAIDAALPGVARIEGGRLVLASPAPGAAGRVTVHEVAGDAAPRVLGLPSRVFRGAAASAARIAGERDLSGGVDLRGHRFLRLTVDGRTAEIDLDPAEAPLTALADVVAAIEGELPGVAAAEGGRLVVASPTIGVGGSVQVRRAAAEDAAEMLFGAAPRVAVGRGARAALVIGTVDVSRGVALPPDARLEAVVDGGPALSARVDGGPLADPEEVAAQLTAALAPAVCTFDGRFLRLASGTAGADGEIQLLAPENGSDAAAALFGVPPRVRRGVAAAAARLAGTAELADATDLRAPARIAVALDGGPAVEVELRVGAGDAEAVTPAELRDAVNAALGAGVASLEARRLVLESPTKGAASRVEVVPRERTERRRFVTRAPVADDAAVSLLGFVSGAAAGTPAAHARIQGDVDLSRGADLSGARWLRVAVDGAPGRDVDCTGAANDPPRAPRPRQAVLDEIVQALTDVLGAGVASHDGTHLRLTSPTPGAAGSVELQQPRGEDALERVMGVEPGSWSGAAPSRVAFVGTADLSAGIDLSAADRVKVGVDGPAVEVTITGADPAATTLGEIAHAINLALAAHVAGHDGVHLHLTSRKTGEESRIVFEAPSERDATRAVFGIAAPRAYSGQAGTRAEVTGAADLSGGVDLRVRRILRVAVDVSAPKEIDCAAATPGEDRAHATAQQVADAVNLAIPGLASVDGGFLRLTSPTAGGGSRIILHPSVSADARAVLFGGAAAEARGEDAGPAALAGTVEVTGSVDASVARTLVVSVDGGRPMALDVAGPEPDRTGLDDAVAALNAQVPCLASRTPDDRLRLASPAAGPESRIEVRPHRVLQLIEYPPEPLRDVRATVVHAGAFTVRNPGAAPAEAEIEIHAPAGAAGPGVAHAESGTGIRLAGALAPGERVIFRAGADGGVRAEIVAADGAHRAARAVAGPDGPRAVLPWEGEHALRPGATLVLDDPAAPAAAVLRALREAVHVRVRPADLSALDALPSAGGLVRAVGRLRQEGGGWVLADGGGAVRARVRPARAVDLAPHRGRPVVVRGRLFAAEDGAPVLLAERVAAAWDVDLRTAGASEHHAAVTVGAGEGGWGWLADAPSALAHASIEPKAGALALPRGTSTWRYRECDGARYDAARFDAACFAGGGCAEWGVFDASRFAGRASDRPCPPRGGASPSSPAPMFAPPPPLPGPGVEVTVRSVIHRPGAFEVRLPAELPAHFGGRFNQARFGGGAEPETYAGVVAEPASDPAYLVTRLGTEEAPVSAFVTTKVVARAPIGWVALDLPLRRPRVQRLQRGRDDRPARLYLRDRGAGLVVELSAVRPGAWGNDVEVTARAAAPGRYDLTVGYGGARVECARAVVRGAEFLPSLAAEIVKAGPLGVLHARAAGVAVHVTREGADPPSSTASPSIPYPGAPS